MRIVLFSFLAVFLIMMFAFPFSADAALVFFGGRILQFYPCLVPGVPGVGIWIAVGPPAPSVVFVAIPPIPEVAMLFANYNVVTIGNMVLGRALVPAVGKCAVPWPPFFAFLPGLIAQKIGTTLIPPP